ncbi:MAG: hypothetical protein UU08_C0022G0002 [Candidatus Uhrbacteria bacterium GW2011_GWE2_40_58]|nr:MAG: hypothetical protein UT94_C0027G0002 [Candidatus Uhrbacteria bacterium GW2011_GWF2_40_263]KKR67251.1 MAG: hypothetical protein UU08_C0022G0002 [Candidatus Uhrbacteria bacterium GW2011_GWE2_40_58]OGL97773.1 MAG: hypothetical protein A2332_02375 [Candidatus Uhrbacteria bacterium RIFOXYB2_FULL_41_18]HBK34966.1 hypothetical protein [Candidatus Uhrbacteria bacterium]HCB55836.1 hypothetical protein [Candidatus Uhrbacteria bacterium]
MHGSQEHPRQHDPARIQEPGHAREEIPEADHPQTDPQDLAPARPRRDRRPTAAHQPAHAPRRDRQHDAGAQVVGKAGGQALEAGRETIRATVRQRLLRARNLDPPKHPKMDLLVGKLVRAHPQRFLRGRRWLVARQHDVVQEDQLVLPTRVGQRPVPQGMGARTQDRLPPRHPLLVRARGVARAKHAMEGRERLRLHGRRQLPQGTAPDRRGTLILRVPLRDAPERGKTEGSAPLLATPTDHRGIKSEAPFMGAFFFLNIQKQLKSNKRKNK